MNETSKGNHGFLSPNVHVFVAILFLALLAVLAFAFRDYQMLRMFAYGEVVTSSNYTKSVHVCEEMSPCLRVFDGWIGTLVERFLIEASRLLELRADRHQPLLLSVLVKESFLIVMAGVLTRIVTMLPIVFGAFTAYRNLALRLLLMLAVFMSLFGWARRNPLFMEQGAVFFDYTAIGFVFLLFALMVRGHTRSFFKASLLLVLGQLIIENLGILTGLAITIHGFMIDRQSPTRAARWRSALTRLVGFGAVSLTAVVVVYYARIQALADQTQFPIGFVPYFQSFWEDYGRGNFAEIHDIIENFFVILAYPSAAGLVIGLLAAFGFPGEIKDHAVLRSHFWAAMGMWFGFLATLVVAMFVSGLYYEMGRQLLPLCAITTLAWAKGIALLAVRLKSRASARARI